MSTTMSRQHTAKYHVSAPNPDTWLEIEVTITVTSGSIGPSRITDASLSATIESLDRAFHYAVEEVVEKSHPPRTELAR
jgi:hypothetical protein